MNETLDQHLYDKEDQFDTKEFYFNRYFFDDLYSVSLGKEIVSFGSTKTYSVVDFFSKMRN